VYNPESCGSQKISAPFVHLPRISDLYRLLPSALYPDTLAADARALPEGEIAAFVIDLSKRGDVGYTGGTYVLTATDPVAKKVVTEKGRFIAIFRKQAYDSWKVIQDINNAESATSK
jgi:hypothetical protein